MTDRLRDSLYSSAPMLAKVRSQASARPWPQMDTGSTRPGYGLRPDRVFSSFRLAEMGSPLAQCDIFEDIAENDGHTRGQLLGRWMDAAYQPAHIIPGDDADPLSVEAARVLGRALRRTNMADLLWHLIEGVGFGYSVANPLWGLVEGSIVPTWFLLAAHRRFLISNDTDELLWTSQDNLYPGESMRSGEWLVARRPGRKVARAGIMRTITWWVLFKRMSITDWIVFAEKFGLPIVLGTYEENASDASRRALLQALVDVGEDGQAVLSELTKIRFESAQVRSGDLSALHPAIAARCDAEISKIISGGTLQVENGSSGSYGLGTVHEARGKRLSAGDGFWLADVIHHGLILPFMAYNPRFARAEPPQLSIQSYTEGLQDAQKYLVLQGMGMPISRGDMQRRFALRQPVSGDVLVMAPNEKPPHAPAPSIRNE